MTNTINITTTAGETFTGTDSELLAVLIWRRFGRDDEAAAAAWRRMLGNGCSTTEFMLMVSRGKEQTKCMQDVLDAFGSTVAYYKDSDHDELMARAYNLGLDKRGGGN